MSIDFEEIRREMAEEKQKNQQNIVSLCAELEALLAQPPSGDILERQTILLDTMLTTLLRDNLHRDKKNGNLNTDRLELSLRIQKQCMDTYKARAAIDYMTALTSPSQAALEISGYSETAERPLPLPPIFPEQTE